MMYQNTEHDSWFQDLKFRSLRLDDLSVLLAGTCTGFIRKDKISQTSLTFT